MIITKHLLVKLSLALILHHRNQNLNKGGDL